MSNGNASIEVGHFAELASAVIQQLPRDIDSITAQGWIENRAALQKALRAALLPDGTKVPYVVTVNHDLSLAAMIRAGQYDWVNSDITSDHFPIKDEEGTKDALELVHFERYIESDDVLRELDRRGLRSATIEELLAFGAKYPELQRQFPIVALGSVWRRLDGRFVPCLWSGAGKRYLGLSWFESGWSDRCRFLAVRK